jgi:hydrophobic/amphiphilic exporter-1 (mainly G- bacteria), HAE1 family
MNITELSVKRPSAIVVVFALFIGLGIMGFLNLGADLFPSVNMPIVSIRSVYPGAGSREVEKDVVKPIEDAVSGLSGIDKIRSVSGEGYGYVILQFTMKTDMNSSFMDVQKAVDAMVDQLPADAEKPVIRKYDMNQEPILIVSVSGKVPYELLYDRADALKQSFENLPGVGNVSLGGGLKKRLEVRIDRIALDYYGVSLETLIQVLQANNVTVPAGLSKQGGTDRVVRVEGEFGSVAEIRDLRIPSAGGGTVPLSEVASVELKYPEATKLVRMNGEAAIGIMVMKRSDANVVETANLVKKSLEKSRKALPPGMTVRVANDATWFIDASIADTERELLESVLVTALVLFLFLRRWRSALIVLVSIPTSLVSTFFMMFLFKFTMNILSLTALALSIGILVDDSIVILENVSRHIASGEDPRTAAVRGRMEIGLAAVAITLCDVVVFAPVAFLTDLVGQFFREFGLTVVFASLFSLFVSFTLTPMLASRMLSGEKPLADETGQSAPKTRFGRFFEESVKGAYRRFLQQALRNRWKVIALVSAAVVASLALVVFGAIPSEFLPSFDQGKLIIDINLGAGANVEKTDSRVKIVEDHLASLPEVSDVFSQIGTDSGTNLARLTVKLKDKGERRNSQATVARELRAWGAGLAGTQFSVTEAGIVGQTSIAGQKAIILTIAGPDRAILASLSREAEAVVRSIEGAVDIENSMRTSQTEISVRIDRLAASAYGLSAGNAALALRTALAGTKAGVYRNAGEEYDVVVGFREDQTRSPEELATIALRNPAGSRIPLGQISSFERTDAPMSLERHERHNVVVIQGNLQGRALSRALADIRAGLSKIDFPAGYTWSFGGDSANMSESFRSLGWALAASILLVYMILILLYDSFLTPAIRMLSLPCGIVGAMCALALTGKSINLISLIGFIMLDGLISKNGTLLIDYTHTLMRRGLPLREALLEAGVTRLRPIIMTSFTMIAGMLPLAVSAGASSEVKSSMAIVLIGGLVTSTMLSPILLPVAYTLIDDARNSRKVRKTAGAATEETNAN